MALSGRSHNNPRASTALERNVLDRDIRMAIEAQMPFNDQDGSSPDIKVEVNNGFVLLKGSVRAFREKERLHRFVMQLRGVRALKDLVKVEPEETVTDQRTALFVRQALDAHAALPPSTVTVHCTNGVCMLRGHLRSAEEKHVAEQVASHCRGVKKVMNELTVDPLEEISDEATARAVRCALAYCQEFDTNGITVSCADGLVVLRGRVPTLMDRSMAEEMTRIQCGVQTVENHITVSSDIDQILADDPPGKSRPKTPRKTKKKSL